MLSDKLKAFLAEHGFNDINDKNEFRGNTYSTPLSEAIDRNLPDLVKELLANGVPVEEKCDGNLSPLQLAARGCFKETCKVILSFGARINFIPKYDTPADQWNLHRRTPLHFAACCPFRHVEAQDTDEQSVDVQASVYAASTHATTSTGARALILEDPNITSKDALDVVKLLLDHGADVNARDDSGETVLFELSAVDMTMEIIKRGSDLHIRNSEGNTALQAVFADFAPILFYKDLSDKEPKQLERTAGCSAPNVEAVRELAAAVIQRSFRRSYYGS